MRRAALWFALMLVAPAAAQDALFSPEGYRIDQYRSPAPDALEGVVVIGPQAAYALWRSDRVGFVDVMPRPPRPKNLSDDVIWREKPRYSIPGALWLPNTGYGEIAEVTLAYWRAGLDALTGGDRGYPLVFFCLDECWMSWNAARRAAAEGHSHVFWFPEGTDGWSFHDYPLEELTAAPGES